MSSLQGKYALVTGGAKGIGLAISRRLVEAGCQVAVCGRDTESLQAAEAELGVRSFVVDLLDEENLSDFLASCGDFDILVNNAGIADSMPLAKIEKAKWDAMMGLNAWVPLRIAQALFPAMQARGWGRVVNIASNAGVTGYTYSSVYCASKHAIVGWTRGLAHELARSGVTFNAVCPGWVETEMMDAAVERIASVTGQSAEQAHKTLAKMSPQNRVVQPQEVAETVAWLCDDRSISVNGQTIILDGGMVMS